MKLKTYTSRTMNEALALVKRDLGSDAVILHTRQYKRGGIFGIGAKDIVEITAAEGRAIGRSRKEKASATRRERLAADTDATGPRKRAPVAVRPAGKASGAPQPSAAGDLIRRTYAAAKAEFAMDQPASSSARQPRVSRPTPVAEAVARPERASPTEANNTGLSGEAGEELAREMRLVKQMVASMMQRQRSHPGANGPTSELAGPLFDQYMALLQQEVSEELADEIVRDVQTSVGETGVHDASRVRDAALQSISRFIPAAETDVADGQGILALRPTNDGRPRTIALIGPTGVGKTTTVAKLAATFKLKQRRHVGLITLDTYRIAAVDQLRTYAEIIGIPLQVVGSPDELPKALRRCSGCDVILIDTAGRSQRDDPKLEQLAAFIHAADPHEVHLVLSSTCTQAVMLDAVERFSRIRTDEIIFTKLDEAVSFGVLLNVARRVNKRLSYLTTGQEVPHHIEPGHPRRVAELVLGGRLEPDGAGIQ